MSYLKEMSGLMVGKHGMKLISWKATLMHKFGWFRKLQAMTMNG